MRGSSPVAQQHGSRFWKAWFSGERVVRPIIAALVDTPHMWPYPAFHEPCAVQGFKAERIHTCPYVTGTDSHRFFTSQWEWDPARFKVASRRNNSLSQSSTYLTFVPCKFPGGVRTNRNSSLIISLLSPAVQAITRAHHSDFPLTAVSKRQKLDRGGRSCQRGGFTLLQPGLRNEQTRSVGRGEGEGGFCRWGWKCISFQRVQIRYRAAQRVERKFLNCRVLVGKG